MKDAHRGQHRRHLATEPAQPHAQFNLSDAPKAPDEGYNHKDVNFKHHARHKEERNALPPGVTPNTI